MVIKCRLNRASPDERRHHIVSVAGQVFVEEGYGATAMSTIAARLGGSKATLYKYFPSKQQLFEAVMEQRCDRVLAPLRDLRSSDQKDLESLLSDFGKRLLIKLYEPAALDLHRLIQSEGARFPELVEAFFRSGPNSVIEELCATLERFAASDQIICEDFEVAAKQFLGMLHGERYLHLSIGILPAPNFEEIENYARQAAHNFVFGLLPR